MMNYMSVGVELPVQESSRHFKSSSSVRSPLAGKPVVVQRRLLGIMNYSTRSDTRRSLLDVATAVLRG